MEVVGALRVAGGERYLLDRRVVVALLGEDAQRRLDELRLRLLALFLPCRPSSFKTDTSC